MRSLARQLTICLFLLGLAFPCSRIFASDDKNEFNPNYLISDEEIQNWQSMSRADVQAFMDSYGGYISKMRTEDKEGKKRKTSDIIYRAAKEHSINPKYLLVKLQKEQSLIMEKNPTKNQLDFATGYDCPDSEPCGENNRGFGKQVDSAAGIIRWYYDNLEKENWIKRTGIEYIIDNIIVKPFNLATAFLYTYTPHLNGNKNFWTLWQRWFGQVYPDGTLVKASDNPTVYIIQDGKKRAISSMSVLLSRFEPNMIVTAPRSELNRYENGASVNLPNYSILKQGENYYLLDCDTIRSFANHEVVRKFGYNPEEIIEVEESDLQGFNMGDMITADTQNITGRLVQVKENKNLYYLKDNYYYPITDPQIAKINFPNLSPEPTKAIELEKYQYAEPLKFKNGILLGARGNNKIYVIENGKKRHISSEEVFNGLGYQWNNIIWTDEAISLYHPEGEPVYLRSRAQLASK